MHKFGMSLFAGVVMFGAVACDDGVADKLENKAKCNQICNEVEKCTSAFDEDSCQDTCEELAEDDTTETKVEACSGCIERLDSCEENAADCADECTGVVVLSSIGG
jgi:hypothetical protein